MIFLVVEGKSETSSIVSGDPFPFPIPDWDEGTSVECIPDQLVDLFGIVSFVHDVKVRMSDSVTLLEEFFGVRNVMDRMLRDLKTGNNLSIGIDRNRGLQEPFSGLTGSPGIVVTCIRAGEPG